MSIINVSLDTDKKVLSVDIDGKKIKNASSISVYKYGDDKFDCAINVNDVVSDSVKSITTYYVYASEILKDFDDSLKDGKSIAGLVQIKQTVADPIKQYFQQTLYKAK